MVFRIKIKDILKNLFEKYIYPYEELKEKAKVVFMMCIAIEGR